MYIYAYVYICIHTYTDIYTDIYTCIYDIHAKYIYIKKIKNYNAGAYHFRWF